MLKPRRLHFEQLEALVMLSGAPSDSESVANDPTVAALFSSFSPEPPAALIAGSANADDDTVPNAGDDTAPTVTSFSPGNGAQNVFTAASVTFTFSEPIDPVTVTTSNIQLLNGATPVAGTLTYNAVARTAMLTPSTALDNSKIYTIVARGGASGIKDVNGNALEDDVTRTFTTAPADTGTFTLFNDADIPDEIDSGDAQPIELGMRVTASVPGHFTGIRFYKSEANTGTHIGKLWSSTGNLLASATFTNETASGWQQVDFATPVARENGQAYMASYHTTSGHYSASAGYFDSQLTRGPLTATRDGVRPIGVYAYGDGGYPTESYESTNYWVDVVFEPAPAVDTTPPTVTAISWTSDPTLEVDFTIRFSEALDLATVTPDNVMLQGPGGTTVATTFNYYEATGTNRLILTPTAPLALSTDYTIFVRGGASGIKDAAGNPLAADVTSSYTTPATGDTHTIFSDNWVPAEIDSGDEGPIEVGLKFHSSHNGFITGIRFYKSVDNTGPHTVHLWSSFGQLLATAPFSGGAGLGWQQVDFATPAAITAGVTYVASYHTASGHYSATPDSLAEPMHSGPLRTPADAGVYAYGAGSYPDQTHRETNYFVAPVFTTTPAEDSTAPTVVGFSPVSGAGDIASITTATVTFSEVMNALTIDSTTIRLLQGVAPVAATVSYDASTKTATLTPSAPLAGLTTYTISVAGGAGGVEDTAGNSLAGTVTSSFTTAQVSNTGTFSLFNKTGVAPSVIDGGDGQPIELGVKFQSSTNGFLTGIRFYKAVTDDGVHIVNLWSGTGQLLATAPFTNPSGTHWQEVSFATPVAITAGTQYVASYHTTGGHYSYTRYFFDSPFVSGPLTALADGGVFAYGPGGYPTQTFQSTNYWVDPVFTTAPPADISPPFVVGLSPATDAVDVATGAAARVTFGEPMKDSTINSTTIQLLDGTTPVAANVSYNAASRIATLTPSAALAESTTYTIRVAGGTGGVEDVAGNPLASTVTSSFITIFPDTTAPTIVDFSPATGAVEVAADATVLVNFNEAMNASTINATTIRLLDGATPVAANVSYDAATNTATLTPSANLANATTYTISVTGGPGGVEDVAGNPLATTATSSFITDATAPTIVNFNPATGSDFLNPGANVAIVFSEAMNTATINSTTIRLFDGAKPVAAAVIHAAEKIVIIDPDSELEYSTTYTVVVTGGAGGVEDFAGNPLANTVTSTFTTKPAITEFSLFNDASTPGVIDSGDAQPIELGMRFQSSTDGYIKGIRVFKAASNDGPHTVNLWSDAGQLLATHEVTFETATGWYQVNFSQVAITAGTQYVISYHTDSGNYSYTRDFFDSPYFNGPLTASGGVYAYGPSSFPTESFQATNYWVDPVFTTTPPTDTTPPSVSGFSPATGATNVATNTTATVTFSEAMNTSTINSTTIRLLDGATPVAATLSYDAETFTATLTPSAPLANSTTYTIWVDGDVRDLTGHQLGDTLGSSFTTVAADTTAPAIVGFSPATGATNVATSTAVMVTFSEAMDASTIDSSTFRLLDGATPVAATFSYDAAAHTATLTPSAALANSKTYTISVTGGAGGVTDTAGNPLASTVTSSFTTAAVASTTYSLFNNTGTPAVIDSGDPQAVELGVKIRADVNGYIASIRFYKAAGNNGTHTAHLWSSTGLLLATATFTGETGSGWQQVDFATPVAITAGATYVASYHTTSGHYSFTRNAFGSAVDSGPLHALANGTSSNGVYAYGAGSFPTQSFQSTNYWVDAVFTTTPPVDTTAPTIVGFSPGSGAANIATSTTVMATFSEAMDATTIDSTTIRLLDGATPVAASVSYDASTKTATLTPNTALDNSKTYTISVTGGAGGVEDTAGNLLASTVTSSFTTAAVNSTTYSLFDNTDTPAVIDGGDAQSIEVGVRFSSNVDGYITGLRYYKAAGNTGTHTAHLWSSDGQLLATATFTSETASGWQQVTFGTPVAITAGETYVASYHTTSGHYSFTRNFFGNPLTNGPLTALAGGGVYAYGAGGYPTQSYQSTNYWVDPVFSTV